MSGRVTKPERSAMTQGAWDDKVAWWTWLFEATDRAVEAWINRPRIGDTRPGSVAVFRPRDHWRSDGQPKVKRTKEQAIAYVKLNTQYRAYRCTVCQDWHVGHKPSKRPTTPPLSLVRLAS